MTQNSTEVPAKWFPTGPLPLPRSRPPTPSTDPAPRRPISEPSPLDGPRSGARIAPSCWVHDSACSSVSQVAMIKPPSLTINGIGLTLPAGLLSVRSVLPVGDIHGMVPHLSHAATNAELRDGLSGRCNDAQYGRKPITFPGGSYSHTQTSRSPPPATPHPTARVLRQTICV